MSRRKPYVPRVGTPRYAVSPPNACFAVVPAKPHPNENATGTSQVGGIYSVKADGGGFGTVTGGVDYPEQVLAVEDDVFFTEISGTAQPLYLFPGSGEPAVFLNEGVAAMTSLGDTVYIVTLATFDASQPNYYDKDASLFAATAAGGITSTIATGLGYAGGIAVDGTNAYVTIPGASSGSGSLGNGEVLQISLAAGTVSTLSSGYMQAMAIASDGTDVYWTNFRDGNGSGTFVGTGSVCKVPVGGGNTITLLAGQTAPTGIEVDSTSVYWMVGSNYGGTAGSGGRVLKLTPK